MNNLLVQYFDEYGQDKENIYSIIENRLNFGAYQLLNEKATNDIVKYSKEDFIKIFNNLYSTQRQSVYNDLVDILNFNENSGLSFLKGIINKFIRAKHIDIEQMYQDTREDIKYYSKNIGKKLKFGKGTILQIAHFCKPEKYPIYNTKSKEVISYIYKTNVIEENLIEFTNYANEIVGQMKLILESDYSEEKFLNYVHKYRYVLLDDFIEFAYELIRE
jgi:hypothetical protein